MPLTVPIEGGAEAAYVPVIYPAFASIEIGSGASYPAASSIDITAESVYDAYSSAEVEKLTQKQVASSIDIVNVTTDQMTQAVEVIAGESFMILADVLSFELLASSLAENAHVFTNGLLKIDGVTTPIKRFNFQKPTGSLGSLLNVTLADPDIDSIPLGAEVYFALVINGLEYPLMTLAQITDESLEIKYRGGKNDGPIDEVTFGSLDVMSDKFTLSPTRSVVMFDPRRVQYDDVRVDPENAVRGEDGRIILPTIEPVNNLTMKKILARAYTGSGGSAFANVMHPSELSTQAWSRLYLASPQTGCGFDRVITNIKDYDVRQADFDLRSGWHDGAQPCIAMYAPMYFVKGNDLVILDVDQPLPYGVTPYDVKLSYHKSLSFRRTRAADKNQVIVTYQYMGNDPYEADVKLSRDVVKDEEVLVDTEAEGGPAEGEEGYMRQVLNETVREWYMALTPDDILDTLPLRTVTTTVQTVVVRDSDGSTNFAGTMTTSTETIEHQYYGNLKTGHTRTLETRLFTPVTLASRNESTMIIAEIERCNITWTDDPAKPGVKLQDRVTITLDEQCVVNVDEPQIMYVEDTDYDHYPLIPLTEANLGGFVNYEDGWRLVASRTKSKTQTRVLRRRRANQYDVLVTDVDHLNGGGAKRSIAQPVIGNVSHNQFQVRSRSILLQNEASIAEIGARVPETVNCYELPRVRALELGQRRLLRLADPLRNMPIDLPVPDLALDRGSVIRGQTRDGYEGNFIVTGLSITGEGLGRDKEHKIFENLECLELLSE